MSEPAELSTDRDVLCPMCDYNLRGITEPRCPECGFRFDWSELLDVTRRQHPYLYEHRRHDSFRSFWQTLLGGLNPWCFWRTLHPAQPSDPKRLRRYLFWCILPLAVACLASLVVYMHYYRSTFTSLFRWYNLSGFRGQPLRLTLFWLMLPVSQFIVLMIFQDSMQRARVKVVHVWRCVVYCCDCMLPLGIVLCLTAGLFAATAIMSSSLGFAGSRWFTYPSQFFVLAHWCMVVLQLVIGVRLAAAYRYYLRFDHPALTVIATQVILYLLVAVLAINGVI